MGAQRLRRRVVGRLARTGGALVLAAAGYGVARGQGIGAQPALLPLYYAGTMVRDGEPVRGEHELRVALYPAEKTGALLCESVQRAQLDDGHFRVLLADERCGAMIAAGAELWVELQLDRGDTPPRARVGAVPYASLATRATRLSEACVGCVDGAKLATVPAEKITGVLTPEQGGVGASDGAWTAVELKNGSNYGGGYTPAGYRKDGATVQVRGLIKDVTGMETPVFVLPEGYRPSAREIFTAWSGTTADIPTRVDVLPNGEVYVWAAGSFRWVSLTSVRFRID